MMPEIIINNQVYEVEGILNDRNSSDDPLFLEINQFCKWWYSDETHMKIHTSGSTGSPKLIRISRSQMTLSAKQTIGFFNLQPGDSLLLCLNPRYIGGKMMLVRAFSHQMKLIAVTPSVNPFASLKMNIGLDFMACTPQQLSTILLDENNISCLNQMKGIIVGGAPVSQILKKELQNIETPVYATYGMTETVSHVALQRLNGNQPSDCYTGLGDVVFDQDERGCLTIIAGVTNRHRIVTNDRVDLLSPTQFRWLGREDNVINSGGIKLQVEQLEDKMSDIFIENNFHNRFFLFPLPDEILGQKLCLAIESERLNKGIVFNFLEKGLQKYEKPKSVYAIYKFYETGSGKIDRNSMIADIQKGLINNELP